MSVEDATRLLKDLRTNTSLKDKLKAAGTAGFERTASAAGFQVIREEFANALKAMVVQTDLSGPSGFQVADSIIQGVGTGVTSVGGGAISGIV